MVSQHLITVRLCRLTLYAESGQSDDDMDMDAFGDDFKVVPKGKRKSYEVEYESLSQGAVEKLIKDDVEHICGIFGVDVSGENIIRGVRLTGTR